MTDKRRLGALKYDLDYYKTKVFKAKTNDLAIAPYENSMSIYYYGDRQRSCVMMDDRKHQLMYHMLEDVEKHTLPKWGFKANHKIITIERMLNRDQTMILLKIHYKCPERLGMEWMLVKMGVQKWISFSWVFTAWNESNPLPLENREKAMEDCWLAPLKES